VTDVLSEPARGTGWHCLTVCFADALVAYERLHGSALP